MIDSFNFAGFFNKGQISNARVVGNVLSGVIFILMSTFRLIARLCNRVRDRKRKKWLFGGLILYAWFVSLGYATAVGILTSTADYCFYCKSADESGYFINGMTFWVLVGMLLVPSVLFCAVIIYYVLWKTFDEQYIPAIK